MVSITNTKVKETKFTFIDVEHEKIKVRFMDYGATIVSLSTPDKNGDFESIVMAFDKVDSYINNDMYLNAIIGPTSGRIKDGMFTINNQVFNIDKNFLGTENLHGGTECFAFKFFKYEVLKEMHQTQVIFKYIKDDATSNYPGTTRVSIIYTVKNNELLIEYIADTDKDTLINLTNHAYFNLSGNMNRNILEHYLRINSSKRMVLDDKFIPIAYTNSKKTFLDFTSITKIKSKMKKEVYNLPTKGIDHPLIFDDVGFDIPQVELHDPISGRHMTMFTTYPAVVVYSHNYPSEAKLKYNTKTQQHLGICFEAQNPPNGINIENTESSILRNGETYYHKTLYKFNVKE